MINSEQLESNKKFFTLSEDFEKLLQHNFQLNDNSDPCETPAGNTLISVGSLQTIFDVEGTPSQILRAIVDDLAIIHFETERVIYNELGYLLIDIELNGTAILVPGFTELPANVKFQHALRFPEIDKW